MSVTPNKSVSSMKARVYVYFVHQHIAGVYHCVWHVEDIQQILAE